MATQPVVVLAENLRQGLVTLAGAGRPKEVCGLLSGRMVGDRDQVPDRWLVTGVHALRNVSARPERSFRLDPVEQLRQTLAVQAAGDEVIGVFHSHPHGPAVPSAEDRSSAEVLPALWCHVLVGEQQEVRAWLLAPATEGGTERAAEELALVAEEPV